MTAPNWRTEAIRSAVCGFLEAFASEAGRLIATKILDKEEQEPQDTVDTKKEEKSDEDKSTRNSPDRATSRGSVA